MAGVRGCQRLAEPVPCVGSTWSSGWRKLACGKHTVFLGASFLAHQSAQHDGERGHLPERKQQLLPGETARKRLGIPMFMGEVH
jgi:hypothetical protein